MEVLAKLKKSIGDFEIYHNKNNSAIIRWPDKNLLGVILFKVSTLNEDILHRLFKLIKFDRKNILFSSLFTSELINRLEYENELEEVFLHEFNTTFNKQKFLTIQLFEYHLQVNQIILHPVGVHMAQKWNLFTPNSMNQLMVKNYSQQMNKNIEILDSLTDKCNYNKLYTEFSNNCVFKTTKLLNLNNASNKEFHNISYVGMYSTFGLLSTIPHFYNLHGSCLKKSLLFKQIRYGLVKGNKTVLNNKKLYTYDYHRKLFDVKPCYLDGKPLIIANETSNYYNLVCVNDINFL